MDTSFLKEQLTKPAKDSKKWRMAVIGLKGIAGFFVTGCVMFFIVPALAPHITTLVQFALTAWGGVVSIFLGAQGTVDFKTTAALQATDENRHVVEEHIERRIDPKDIDDPTIP